MGLRKISLMAVLCVVFVIGAEAQSSGVADCAQNLIPCASYLNSTKPPSSCCTPLKKAVETQLKCLCDLFNTPGLLQQFNVNITQALQLSRNCGITQGIDSCTGTKAPSPSSSSVPPATPGHDNGDASRVAFTGFSFLVLFWASMLFN